MGVMMGRLLTILLAMVSLTGVVSAGSQNPFRVEATNLTLKPGGSGEGQVILRIPKDHHLYRDMMEVTRLSPDGAVSTGAPSFPPGFTKPDPADPTATREQYDMDVVVLVPVNKVENAGTYTLKFEVRYQGCKKSLCWMPQTEIVESTVIVGDSSK
jgi:hypothetical protein